MFSTCLSTCLSKQRCYLYKLVLNDLLKGTVKQLIYMKCSLRNEQFTSHAVNSVQNSRCTVDGQKANDNEQSDETQ